MEHPGKFLKKILDDHGLSGYEFAGLIDVPINRISDIIRGRRSITADSALRFSRYFGTLSAKSWMEVQSEYNLACAIEKSGKIIKQTIKPRN